MTSSPSKVTYDYEGLDGYTLYGYAENGGIETVSASCGGKIVDGNISIKDFPITFPVGNANAGDTVSLTLSAKSDTQSGHYEIVVYALNDALFEEAYSRLADEQLQIEKFTDTKITGKINVLKDGILCLSMPYEKGWRVYCDGEEIETLPVLNALMGAELPAGAHDITIEYTPEGFSVGAAVSAAALLLFVLLAVLDMRRKKKTAKEKDNSEASASDDAEPAADEVSEAPENEESHAPDTSPEKTEEDMQ